MKKILFIVPLAIFIVVGCRPTTNETYGTDRYSQQQKETCERRTGKKCIFDLCQVAAGGPAPPCDPGWKPEY